MSVAEFEAKMPVSEYVERFVDVDKFLEKCKECPMYDRKWSCPSFDFDPLDFWKNYRTIRLVARKINIDKHSEEDPQDIFYSARKRLLYKIKAMESLSPRSVTLAAGSCDYCGRDNCARARGERCTYPDKCQYSLEALGGDVELTAKELFGLDMQWDLNGELPDYYVIVGALLTID